MKVIIDSQTAFFQPLCLEHTKTHTLYNLRLIYMTNTEWKNKPIEGNTYIVEVSKIRKLKRTAI